MSDPEPRLPEYLDHILEAIRRIGRYTEDMAEPAFLTDELVQDGVIRNLEIVGEAARNVERRHPEFAGQHPEVPWALVYAMRNRMAHGYSTLISRLFGEPSRTICRKLKNPSSAFATGCLDMMPEREMIRRCQTNVYLTNSGGVL